MLIEAYLVGKRQGLLINSRVYWLKNSEDDLTPLIGIQVGFNVNKVIHRGKTIANDGPKGMVLVKDWLKLVKPIEIDVIEEGKLFELERGNCSSPWEFWCARARHDVRYS